MYEQTEYLLAYALVFAFLILGMLIVCIPRPRKKEFITAETAAKLKRQKQVDKIKSIADKKSDKVRKTKAKAKAKRQKSKN